MSQEARVEKANEGRKDVERNLDSLTDDGFLSCSGERASLYRIRIDLAALPPKFRQGEEP